MSHPHWSAGSLDKVLETRGQLVVIDSGEGETRKRCSDDGRERILNIVR